MRIVASIPLLLVLIALGPSGCGSSAATPAAADAGAGTGSDGSGTASDGAAGGDAQTAAVGYWTQLAATGLPKVIASPSMVVIGTSLYVGTKQASGETVGLYKSDDAGLTFKKLTLDATCISVDGLYATPTGKLLVFCGVAKPGHGLYASTDGGATFSDATKGMPDAYSYGARPIEFGGKIFHSCSSFSSDDAVSWNSDNARPAGQPYTIGGNLYCQVMAVYNNKTFQSTDGGLTWKDVSDPSVKLSQVSGFVLHAGAIFASDTSPSDPGNLSNSTGVSSIATTSDGLKWSKVTSLPVDVTNVPYRLLFSTGKQLFVALEGPTEETATKPSAGPNFVSVDGGKTFGPVGQMEQNHNLPLDRPNAMAVLGDNVLALSNAGLAKRALASF